jgi:hypothetical protein
MPKRKKIPAILQQTLGSHTARVTQLDRHIQMLQKRLDEMQQRRQALIDDQATAIADVLEVIGLDRNLPATLDPKTLDLLIPD